MATIDIPAIVVGTGVFTTLVGGTSCVTSSDGDTSYMQQHVALSSATSGFNDRIQFPATVVPGDVASVSLVTVTKGVDHARAALFLIDESSSTHFWKGIFADGATDWTETVTPLTASGVEVVTKAMLEAGTVQYSSGSALLNSIYTGPVDVTLQWTYIALRVEYTSPCFDTLTATRDPRPGSSANAPDDVVWRDGNPGTYATKDDFSGLLTGLLDAYTGPTATDLTVGIVAAAPSGDTFDVNLYSGYGTGTTLLAWATFTAPAGSVQTTYEHTFTPSDYVGFGHTFEDVIAGLRTADAIIEPSGESPGIMVSEMWVRVGHKCYVLAPPLRRYPRAGVSGPTRHWPRSLSRRPGTF